MQQGGIVGVELRVKKLFARRVLFSIFQHENALQGQAASGMMVGEPLRTETFLGSLNVKVRFLGVAMIHSNPPLDVLILIYKALHQIVEVMALGDFPANLLRRLLTDLTETAAQLDESPNRVHFTLLARGGYDNSRVVRYLFSALTEPELYWLGQLPV
ncbi:MAG: hypothetical protein RMJ19_08205 [Gemmatales bacterium]|nr:hypothetical protein [Gemmatales bacterium]MDW8175640.1 hypothetical protein [Gemmatales bacterium]MDW8221824.1 hypothetical protein [Gemmatales bacterium]